MNWAWGVLLGIAFALEPVASARAASVEIADAPEPVLAQPAEALGYKGMNGNELYLLTPGELEQSVAKFRDLGVQWVRFDFDWSVIQPESADRYEPAPFDRVVKALSQAGIRMLGIIDYTPAWANGGKTSKFYPPKEPEQFATFAAYLAKRYAPMGVHAWEIWNEPNLGQFWQPAPDAVRYARLLKAAYPAIHQADPLATVVSGGLAQPGNSATSIRAADFLAALYRHGAGNYFDAVGNHPYSSPALPEDSGGNWKRMFTGGGNLRTIMAANDDGHKKIWITEFGAPKLGKERYGTVITESRQARMVEQAYRLVSRYSWAGPLFWYNLQDFCPEEPTENAECFYGVLRHDGSEKPAAKAYRQAQKDR